MNNSYNGEFVLYAAIIAITLSKDLTPNEQNALGNFFQAIGQNLEVIACNNVFRSKNQNFNSNPKLFLNN